MGFTGQLWDGRLLNQPSDRSARCMWQGGPSSQRLWDYCRAGPELGITARGPCAVSDGLDGTSDGAAD